MKARLEKLIKSYHPIINALQDHVDRLEAIRTANSQKISQADAIAIEIPRKPPKSTGQSIRKMIVKLGGFRPENYEKIIAYLDNKVVSLEQHIKKLENIVAGATGPPSPEIKLNQGPLAMIDFIEKDRRRPTFLALHERSTGRVIHATTSLALGNSLVDPSEIIGHDLQEVFDDASYKSAIQRIRTADKVGYHRKVNWFRRNLLDHQCDMRIFVPPGEKHLLVNLLLITDYKMSKCHLTQPVERYDFTAAYKFYDMDDMDLCFHPLPEGSFERFREVA